MHQLNTGAYLIRMQKINTENIYKYLQPEKSGGFKKSLLFVQRSGGFKKSLLFAENQADLRNPCFLQKIRRIYRILALLQKSGGFTESLRFSKNQADLQNPCAFLKIRRIYRILAAVKIPGPGEKTSGLEKTGGPLTV